MRHHRLALLLVLVALAPKCTTAVNYADAAPPGVPPTDYADAAPPGMAPAEDPADLAPPAAAPAENTAPSGAAPDAAAPAAAPADDPPNSAASPDAAPGASDQAPAAGPAEDHPLEPYEAIPAEGDTSAALEELPPLLPHPDLSFANPFSQYVGGIIPHFEYGGEATLANDYMTLTPGSPGATGWVWTEEIVEYPAWEVQIDFHIGGPTARGAGGGMAFWYTAQQGRAGPIYGHDDHFEGLGVFFDTYEGEDGNGSEPFVVAMMNFGEPLGEGDDPQYYKNQVGVCFAAYRNLNTIAQARIVWTGSKLQVWLDMERTGQFQSCLATEIGDSRLKLPEKGYFGLSAATGDHADSHVIYSFQFATINADFESKPLARPLNPHGVPAVESEHVVHHEGRHNEHHVPFHGASHGSHAKGEFVDAAEQVAHHVPAPPAQTTEIYMNRFSSELEAIEASVIDLSSESQKTMKVIISTQQDVHQQLGAFYEQLHNMSQALYGVQETTNYVQATTEKSHEALTDKNRWDDKEANKLRNRDIKERNDDRVGQSIMQGLRKDQGRLKESLTSTLGEHGDKINSLAKGLADVEEKVVRMSAKMVNGLEDQSAQLHTLDMAMKNSARASAAQTRALEGMKTSLDGLMAEVRTEIQAKRDTPPPSQTPLVAVAVCAQLVVVATFFFYRTVTDRKRGHII